MRKISKGQEPTELKDWKQRNPKKKYKDTHANVKQAIRQSCIIEQKGLCAFCCTPVDVGTSHNAHLKCQADFPALSLVWENIVASCQVKDRCGHKQGQEELPITPLMDECERDFKFSISGRMRALTPDAEQTRDILNLDSPALRQRRKKAIIDMEFAPDFQPFQDIQEWDTELLRHFIELGLKEDDKGKLTPFAPVLVNIARQFLP